MLLSERGSSPTFREAVAKKTILPQQLETFAQSVREEGSSLVTINGCFDILHPGHLEMLYQASQQGTILLVLLNTDASIRSYKGPSRPINPLEVRLQHVAALECVDFVSYFNEADPIRALRAIKPDVHCNGSEYTEQCIEADAVKEGGGRIHIIELVEGYSTTRFIERIKNTCD